ncbi:MAG: STAS domain-containing protein [Bryobacteraceae bacterium]
MPLDLARRVEDNFAILDVTGSLTLGPSLKGLRDAVRDLLADTKLAGIILRVADITATDSAGLGELTVVYSIASKRGCPIRLVAVSPNLRRMLEVTHLDGLLPSAPDVASAKRELRKSSAASG